MSIPRAHHYIPASYLKRWCGIDNKLQEFRQPYSKKIVIKRIGKDATGWSWDLYRAPTSDAENSQIFETKFLRPIDEHAYRISSRMIDGDATLSNRDRVHWSRFLLSLLLRSPQDLAFLEAWVKDEWRRDCSLSSRSADELKKISLRLFIRICNDESVKAICRMKWQIVSVISDLVTSDRPLVMTNGVGYHDSYIILPLAPRCTFFAYNSRAVHRNIIGMQLTTLPDQINKVVICRAKEFVWSADLSSSEYIMNNMCTEVPPSIIPAVHKAARTIANSSPT